MAPEIRTSSVIIKTILSYVWKLTIYLIVYYKYMNFDDTQIIPGEDLRFLQTTKHFVDFCDRVYRAATAHPDFRTISSRVAFYIQELLTVKEAYAKIEYVRRRIGELIDSNIIGCFNRHELNSLGNKINLPKPRIIFPNCDWKGHRSC